MFSNAWILLVFILVLVSPFVLLYLKDKFYWGSNKFYGDELNKEKKGVSKKDESYEKSSQHMHTGEGTFWGRNDNS